MKAARMLVVSVLLLAAACSSSSSGPEPLWQHDEVPAPSDRVLWKIALLALDKQGYPLASGLDPSAMVVTSGWKTELAPFSKQGFRTRAEVRMEPRGKGLWDVQTRVERQVNESIVKPLDPQYANWKWTEDDGVAAGILLQHIRAFLDLSIEPTEQPSDPLEAHREPRLGRD